MFKKILAIITIVFFLGLNSIAAKEAGLIAPTGNQVEAGIVDPVGNWENYQTGPESTNANETQTQDSTTIDAENQTNVDNQVDSNLDTGSNQTSTNNTVGDSTTGDINGSATIIDATGTNLDPQSSYGVQDIDGTTAGGEIQLGPIGNRTFFNDTTGPDSENINVAETNTNFEIINQNETALNNDITIDANTGENIIAQNTVVGDVTTGNIDLVLNLLNLANLGLDPLLLNVDVFNVYGGYSGDFILSNLLTGPNSTNLNDVIQSSNYSADLLNQLSFNNNLDINTNTGQNSILNNTAIGSLTTGDVNVDSTVSNIADLSLLPMLYIFNVFGDWNGDLLGLDPGQVIINVINDTTGPNSDNTNIVAENNNTDVQLTNEAEIANNININANTGRNTVKENTLVGDISTGAINLGVNVLNAISSFGAKVGQFALGIVNIFGDFEGDIKPVGFKEEEEVAVAGPIKSIAKEGAKIEAPIAEEAVPQIPSAEEPTEVAEEEPAREVLGVSEISEEAPQQELAEAGANNIYDHNNSLINAKKESGIPLPVRLAAYIAAAFLALWITYEILTLKRTQAKKN